MNEAKGAGASEASFACQGNETIPVWFIRSAVAILAVFGTAKIWSAFGGTKVLAAIDPITQMQFGHLMFVVGVAELGVAGVCLFSKSQKVSLALVAWLSTAFLTYRLGLWWIGWARPCSCMGNLTDSLHLSPETADIIVKATLTYLLTGSYGLLFWRRWMHV